MKDSIQLSDLRILVVDDSDFSRSMILQMLTEAGCQYVSETNSAESAMRLIREKKPQIVIADIVMPEISGIELTSKINDTFDNVYVIMISSLSQEHIVLEAISSGASDFISKPVQKNQLIESILKIASNISKE